MEQAITRKSTWQDISWFYDLHQQDRLDLEPSYQRRSVWSTRERIYFLETIFRNYPCPPIFLHKELNETGRAIYHVIDGKQRLETILKFIDNMLVIPKTSGETSEKRWIDLETEQKRAFFNYSLPVEILDTIESATLREIFTRFNHNSQKLSPQELRHAKYTGWFAEKVEAEREKDLDTWATYNVTSLKKESRMKDSEFLAELFLVILDRQLLKLDQELLDQKYAQYDVSEDQAPETFDEHLERVKKFLQEIEQHNQCVSKYAQSKSNFYTLWGVIALENVSLSPAEFANRYAEFMENVKEIKRQNSDDLPPTTSQQTAFPQPAEYEESVKIYYSNASGSSTTNLLPRQKRADALKKAILL